MWLRKAYQAHRFTTIVIIFFFTLQLLNNIRQDIAISPWYAYGMYSKPEMVDTGIRAVTIIVNNYTLDPLDFMPQVWDKIAQPLLLYCDHVAWNQFVYETDIRRLMPFVNEQNFSNYIARQAFVAWYCRYLEKITNKKIESLYAEVASYAFEQGYWHKTSVVETLEIPNHE